MTASWAEREPHVYWDLGGIPRPCWCLTGRDHYADPPLVVDGPSIDTYPEEHP